MKYSTAYCNMWEGNVCIPSGVVDGVDEFLQLRTLRRAQIAGLLISTGCVDVHAGRHSVFRVELIVVGGV